MIKMNLGKISLECFEKLRLAKISRKKSLLEPGRIFYALLGTACKKNEFLKETRKKFLGE